MFIPELQHTEINETSYSVRQFMLNFSSLNLCTMERHERVARAIAMSGKKKSQIAAECGVANSAVTQWIDGSSKSMKPENLYGLAKATGFNPEWIAMGHGPERPAPPGSDQGAQHANVGPTIQPYRDAKEYPLISWIAAGVWQESCDNFHPGDAEEWIDSHANAGPCGYWLTVKGKSMVAPSEGVSFTPGMRILVQPEGFDLISGRYYIARLLSTGETTFKQYIRDAGTEYLQPLNPNYKTMEMGADVEIIGRVVDAKLPKSLF